jgi:hypothetical protein
MENQKSPKHTMKEEFESQIVSKRPPPFLRVFELGDQLHRFIVSGRGKPTKNIRFLENVDQCSIEHFNLEGIDLFGIT